MTPDPRHEAIVRLAQDEYAKQGEIEILSHAPISEGIDNGCYVAAWVWVSFEGTPFDKEA